MRTLRATEVKWLATKLVSSSNSDPYWSDAQSLGLSVIRGFPSPTLSWPKLCRSVVFTLSIQTHKRISQLFMYIYIIPLSQIAENNSFIYGPTLHLNLVGTLGGTLENCQLSSVRMHKCSHAFAHACVHTHTCTHTSCLDYSEGHGSDKAPYPMDNYGGGDGGNSTLFNVSYMFTHTLIWPQR